MQKYFNSLYSARPAPKSSVSPIHPAVSVAVGDKIKIYLRILIKCAIFA